MTQNDKNAVSELVNKIRAIPGMSRQVVSVYNGSQGGADCDAPEDSETYAWAQHDYAIERLAEFLAEKGLADHTVTSETISFAFSEVS